MDVFTENVRSVTVMDSPQFGKVCLVCVGAMMVGSIVLTQEKGAFKRYVHASHYDRMDEHGYFAFGGSTLLAIFQKHKVEFDKDLLDNSEKCIETIVKVGNSIGRSIFL